MSIREVTAPPGYPYLSMTAAAERISISPAWLRDLILEGKVDALQMRRGKYVYRWIRADDMMPLIARYNTPVGKQRRRTMLFGKARRPRLKYRCPRCGVVCPQWRTNNEKEGRYRRKCSHCRRHYTLPRSNESHPPLPPPRPQPLDW